MTNAPLDRTDARALIITHPRCTLVVRFVKRTTGEMRRMVCIYYPEHAEEATFRFNPVAKGLLAVWDVEKGARRFINLDGVQSVKAAGQRLGGATHARFNERRAADRAPAKRSGGDATETTQDVPQPSTPPAQEAKSNERPWEDLEQADREMAYLFDTFKL